MWQQLMRHIWVLIACTAIVAVPLAWGRPHGPDWTIGRAVVVKLQRRSAMQPNLYLKLSLRNVGMPGHLSVRIFGRWSGYAQQGKWGRSAWAGTERDGTGTRWRMPPGMLLLGQYRREVNLNQTAILTVPLARLGLPGRSTNRLEVVVMTASNLTDHRFVRF